MKNINIEEVKRYLKRSLKKKVKITTSLIVLFMMSNSIGMATYVTIDNGKIGEFGKKKDYKPGSIALNPKGEKDGLPQKEVVGNYSIAIGLGAEANNSDSVSVGHESKANAVNSVAIGNKAEVTKDENDAIAIGYLAQVMLSDKTDANVEAGSIAIGKNARTWLIKSTAIGIDSEVVSLKTFDKASASGGGQGLAVGSGSKAVDQATSLGNETFAIGRSSIAIGSDDNDQFQEKITKEDFNHYFKKLFKVIDHDGTGYGYDENANLVAPNKRRYSPTLAAGEGGIALGTRALSYGIGATSIGAFSYALGDYSTAMGAKTRAEGAGAIAIGNETKVFSDNSVAVGNKNEVSENGGMAYGYNAISSGINTIAIGSNVYGNVNIDTEKVTDGVHKQYRDDANDETTIKTIDTDFEDKNIEKTLKDLENLYKKQSYTTTLVDKKLEFNGKVESTGKQVKKSSGNNAIVVGTDSVAKGENSITFGHAAFGMKDNTVSIGSYTYVNGKNSLGLGIASRVFSDNSLSIGVGSVITHNANNSLVFGNSSVVRSKNSLAIGNYSKAELGNSISIGNHSNTDYNPEWLEEPGYAPKGAISTLTSKGIGVVSIGTIGKERRLTNLASGYRDTDAVNVSQLRSLEEKLSTVNPDEEDTSMMNYLSVDKNNKSGEGYKTKEIAMKEVYYKEYIKLKAKSLEMQVRKERNDEHFKKGYVDKIDNRIKELEGKSIKEINDAKTKTGVYGKYTDEYIKTGETVKEINGEKVKEIKSVDQVLKEISDSKDAALAKKILKDKEIEKIKASNYNNDGATGADSIALGYGANAKGSQAVAIGKNAEGNGSQSVVIGTPNSGNGNENDTSSNIGEISAGEFAVSIGNGVKSDKYAVGIGGNVVSGDTAVAIGDRARAIGKYGIAIGEKAKVEKENGIAFGNIATSTEKNAIAIGNSSKATKENAIALGQGAKSEQNDSVAIGNGSEAKLSTDKAYLTDDQNSGGRTFAVGGTNIKRRITGVADGSADSDAVTVKQLKKLSEKGITFKDDKDTKTTVGLAGEIKISGKEENNHRNISVTTNNKNLEVTLSKTLKGITSIENGDNSAKLTLNNDNITVNNKKLTGLANGSSDSDAVAYGQVKNPFKVVADNSATGLDQALGKKIEITGRKVTNNVISSDAWSVTGNNNPKNGRYTTENIETFVSSSGEGTRVLVGLREDPTFKKITLKDGDTKQVELTPTTDSLSLNSKKISGLSNGSDDTDAVAYGQVKKPFKVVADNNANGVDHNLGNKIEITGRKSINDSTPEAWDVKDNNSKKGRYTTENIETFVRTSGEGTQVLVGLREDPTFKEVKLANSGKNVKFGIDNKGNATLTDAQNTTASPIVTEATVGNQKISYAANSKNKKETTLTTGFDFTSNDLEIKTKDNGKVTFNLTDTLKNSLNGKGNDGKDGKDGTKGNDGAGSKGLTGIDGLNGKDLTTKVNALRNGEAGTVVYTDKDGKRLVKANDGKYYEATNVNEKGEVQNNATAKKDNEVLATLVNPDGSTTTPTTKLRVADGSITADSKEAINGGQLKTELDKKLDKTIYETEKQTFATKTELETSKVEVVGTENEIVVTPEAKADGKGTKYTVKLNDTLKTKIAGALQTSTAESTYAKKDASNITEANWVEKLGDTNIENGTKLAKSSEVKAYVDGKGLKFTADNAADNLVKLGETLSIVGRSGENNQEVKTWKHGPNDQQDKQEDYTTENVTTHYEKTTDGKQQIFVGIKEKPTFKKITLKDGDTKQVDLTPTKDGLSLNGKKLTGLNAGTGDTDAINKKQFDDALNKKANATDLSGYAKVGLDNISVEGKKVIKGLINVSKDATVTDNILEIDGGNEKDGQAKDYKLSVKKSTIEGIAKEEAKKFVSDSVTVSSTDNGITVAKDTSVENKVEYKLTLNQAKIKELSGTTNLSTEYAKVDASNLDKTNETTNRDKWINKLGTEKISEKITENAAKGKLTTEKAVVDYVKQEIDTVNKNIGNTIAYKANSGASKTTSLTTGFDFTSTDLEIKTGDNGKVTFNLTDTLKNSLNGKGNDGKDGKDGTKGNDGAGSKGLTEKDKLNGKDLTTKVNALRNGEAGTVVYTDKDGNRLVKANNGDYYKAEDVKDDGNAKDDKKNVTEIKATLVNPDGSTTTPTTKLRVADGSIAKDSKEAINGGQLKKELDKKLDVTTYTEDKKTFATKTELKDSKVEVEGTKDEIVVTSGTKADGKGTKYTVKLEDALKTKINGALQTSTAESTYAKVDGSNIKGLTDDNKKAWATGIGTSSIDATSKDQLVTDSAVKTYVDGKGLKFTADNKLDNLVKLGETLSIVGRIGTDHLGVKTWKHGPNDQQDKQEDYTTENVTTHYENGKLFVGIKENPTFKKIALKDGETKQVDLTPTTDGLSLNNKKLTGLADATSNTDAINKKQFDDALKGKVDSTDLSGYAKVDASNLDENNATTNRDKWINKLGVTSINKDTTDNSKNGKLTTEKAVVDYVKQEIDTVNKNIGNNTIAYKANSGASKTTSLTTGFDFTSTDLKITTENDGKVTFNLTDKVKNSLNGKGNDGKDGKDGTKGNDGAGSKGLTEKDKLNGKDLTTKVNALRNGEAGTVVYTDSEGNRLVKANNGDYYKAEDVEATGEAKKDKQKATEIKATLVNPDGSTKEPTTKLRVADGSIAADSKDAINGGQLHTELGKKLDVTTYNKDKETFVTKTELKDSKIEVEGTKDEIVVTSGTKADGKGTKYTVKLEDALKTKINGALQTSTAESTYAKVDGSNIKGLTDDNKKAWATGIGTSSIDATSKDQLVTDSAVKTYVDGKGLKFTADNKLDNLVKLGETLSIVGRIGTDHLGVKTWKHGPNDQQDKQEDYTTENVTTHYENGKLFVGIKENPTFKKIALKDGETKQVDLTPTTDGLSLNNKKLTGIKDEDVNTNDNYGTAGVAATQKEVKDYVAKEITKVNDTVSSSKLKLSDGKQTNPTTKDLNIKDETLELVDGTNTTVTLTKDDAKKKATFKVDVKGDLTGITSIENKGTTVTLTEKGTEFKTGTDGVTTKIGKEGIKITKQGEQNPSVSIKAGDTTNGPSIDFATKEEGQGTDKKTVGTGSITGLKDRKASDKTNDYGTGENIGRAATEGAVKEVYDQINSNTGIKKSVGDGKDGRDGKDGTNSAGSKGLTGKDGLNGKDLTTKVNALRNGEAGTVVYTDSEGNRLVKDNKGDYYKAGDVEDDGKAKEGKQKVTEIKATLVNPDGSTTTPTTVLRVADGSILADSKDAINGGQLNNLGYMLGLEVNGKNTGFKAPKITDLKGTNTTPANILDGLNQTREHINKGLTFEANYNADGYGASSLNRIFGETLSITASGAENGKYVGKDNSNYTGDNLATYVKQGKFYIGMKETPTFKSINIGSTGFGEHQTDKGKGDITADNEGLKLSYDNASVTIAKDGDKAKLSGLKDANIDENTYGTAGVAATQKEVKDVLNKINANGTEQDKLKNGTLGTLVYTDKDGNKLMKYTDGKFYKAQADGTKEENAQEVVSEDVILSTVKPDGKTTEPITLGNVASALGLSKDKKDKNNEILNKLVNKEDKKDVFKDVELNKVVTLRDLQFLASKGITFAGSTGTATKFLGDTITINGTASNYKGLDNNNFATKYETKNIAVKVDNNTGNIEVGLAKELKAIESIENKETKVTLKENGTEFKTGADGVTTKIGKDGIEITKKDATKPSVSIKESSIGFETKEEGQGNDKKTVGTGSITGLKDLDDKSDGHMAANKNYVDEKVKTITGDIEKLKNKGLKFAGNTGETKELNDKVNIKGEGTEANNFESAKGNINVVANDSGVELKLAANLKNMKSFEAKDDKGNTVNITGDKIEFKKNNKSTLTINSDGTITGLKTNSSPFEYYEKNKEAVLGKDGTEYKAGTVVAEDGKVYAKGTQEVEGKYFAAGDKVVKAKDGKFYKEKDIKDRTYDEKTKKWSGDSAQPTEATEAKALEGNDLNNAKAENKVVVKGKDNKFYEASDFEKAEYDEAKNEYTKDGKKLEGKEAKDVVIKALPNNEPMTLTNIANARLVKNSKDAVNAGQMLEELDKKMNKDGSNIDKKKFANNMSEGANITKPEGILVTDKQVNEHLKNNYYNKTQVNNMISTIDNKSTVALEKSELALGGVANAVAMANLVQVNSYSRHRHNLSAAYGYYGGSHALAVGFSGTNEERNFVYKLSGSVNNKGNLAFGVGAGVMLGEEHDTFPNIDNKKIKEVTKKLNEANKKISEYEDDKKQTAKKFKELEDKYENDKKESNKKLQEMERKLEMLMKKFK